MTELCPVHAPVIDRLFRRMVFAAITVAAAVAVLAVVIATRLWPVGLLGAVLGFTGGGIGLANIRSVRAWRASSSQCSGCRPSREVQP